MKKALKVVALAMVAVMLCAVLASCGKTLSGKYSSKEVLGTGTTFEFKGSKVTITMKAMGVELGSVEGKYSIKDDKITLTFEETDDEKTKEELKKYSGTFDFEQGDDYIKIGLATYKKA